MIHHHRSKRPTNRRGTITVCVLACMVVVISLCLSLMYSANRVRRETKLRHQVLQTERFLDAAILRSVKQYRADNQFTRESWETEIDFQGQTIPAIAEIQVDENLVVSIKAHLGTSPQLTQQSYQFQLSAKDET
ncbi:hypothetical protein LOC67_03350 [Stieleria sp. JC731]|uniref:hypothetical protein n=1 Tax=Pirellulaceae TaxID=2691357 RepID=UPI001E2909FA|nr:hypothetical protein [Stieleria sp. JC731]MCC9599584.1 hypothetical protein [Stieleria sp. JC731]